MKDISTIRRTVAIMANQLRKLGYTLSKAFKTAWTRVKEGMTVKAQGVTFGNRQGLLQFIAGRKQEESRKISPHTLDVTGQTHSTKTPWL